LAYLAAGSEAAITSSYGAFSEAPLVAPIIRTAETARQGEIRKAVWDEFAGWIPMFAANLAQDIDAWKSRKPETFTQALEMKIPGLRGDVPETKAQKLKDMREKLKKQREPATHRQ